MQVQNTAYKVCMPSLPKGPQTSLPLADKLFHQGTSKHFIVLSWILQHFWKVPGGRAEVPCLKLCLDKSRSWGFWFPVCCLAGCGVWSVESPKTRWTSQHLLTESCLHYIAEDGIGMNKECFVLKSGLSYCRWYNSLYLLGEDSLRLSLSVLRPLIFVMAAPDKVSHFLCVSMLRVVCRRKFGHVLDSVSFIYPSCLLEVRPCSWSLQTNLSVCVHLRRHQLFPLQHKMLPGSGSWQDLANVDML